MEMSDAVKGKVINLLRKLKEHHPPTFEHSIRVGALSRQLGAMQNRDSKAGLYAALHDIGKINIPTELLNKTRGFGEEDMYVMRRHVVDGYHILLDAGLYFSSWIALTHHRYQPNFYPSDEEMLNFPFPIKDASPATRLLADTWSSITGMADAYDSARNRRNDRFGGISLSPDELREWLIKQNPSSEKIITTAYERGIFSLKQIE